MFTPVQSRVEEFQPEEKFDAVLSRAFASVLKIWWNGASICLKKNQAVFLALKGQVPEQ